MVISVKCGYITVTKVGFVFFPPSVCVCTDRQKRQMMVNVIILFCWVTDLSNNNTLEEVDSAVENGHSAVSI